MDERLAEAVGDVMLLLHTRARGEPAPLLEEAIVRFARQFAESGVAKATMIGVLQGLIDQAVAAADLTQLAIVQLADDLQCRAISRCVDAYDAVHH